MIPQYIVMPDVIRHPDLDTGLRNLKVIYDRYDEIKIVNKSYLG